ncbi:EF-hand calcium-binding domain-containing protein 1 [Orchesella cincta]|uniref:EF-hand calcium-binding domain-containing protein 1 n=1 Tax=Orchesella cincta TaxID=48709 RepID=A0A1D2NDF0_ORCCI|nr:EF-hand calcium-binding domain-containing protein 1 [Orchesella cincta]
MTGKSGLAKQHKIQATAELLTKSTHFTVDECKNLLLFHERMLVIGPLDRLRFREILHVTFCITDDVMLDLVYHAFDRDSDGVINPSEWVIGLSVMLRGDIQQLIDFVYFVYDMNGDRSLAREELTHCLKGCIYMGYGIDNDELDECERDIIEIAMRKLDVDKDSQITETDFQNACYEDPLLLQACGPCLPPDRSTAAFLALITDKYRNFTQCYHRHWVGGDQKGKPTQKKRSENLFETAVDI